MSQPSARQCRKLAQQHAVQAALLLNGRPNLTPAERTSALTAAINHLATAMGQASVALALQDNPVDIPAAAEDLVSGLEKLLGGQP